MFFVIDVLEHYGYHLDLILLIIFLLFLIHILSSILVRFCDFFSLILCIGLVNLWPTMLSLRFSLCNYCTDTAQSKFWLCPLENACQNLMGTVGCYCRI